MYSIKGEVKKLDEEMKSLKNNFEDRNVQEKSTKQQLNDIQTKRSKTLLELLNTICDKIDQIYINLTKKDHLIYGRAHLTISDHKRPFDGPINYVPNPPGKRNVFDISQLSSGEKSMAALGFLFTLVKYWKLPFLVLDEADTHLDDVHILKITEYICKKLNKQCVFVSHKEKTIEAADSLVGVTFDVSQKTSQ